MTTPTQDSNTKMALYALNNLLLDETYKEENFFDDTVKYPNDSVLDFQILTLENINKTINWINNQGDVPLLDLIPVMKTDGIFDILVELLYSFFYTCELVIDAETVRELIQKLQS
jgi:hypothetical protein